MSWNLRLCLLSVVLFASLVCSQNEPASTGHGISTTTSTPATTPSLEQDCASRNSSCDECVKNPKCLFCYKPQKCVPYPVGSIIPKSEVCALDKARWGVCLINYKALIISMGVIGGAIVLAITCCCVYCCCCRSNSKNKRKYMAEEAKWESEREARKARNDERRAERQSKLDDIRRKYGGSREDEETEGLMKDDTPYQRFEES